MQKKSDPVKKKYFVLCSAALYYSRYFDSQPRMSQIKMGFIRSSFEKGRKTASQDTILASQKSRIKYTEEGLIFKRGRKEILL